VLQAASDNHEWFFTHQPSSFFFAMIAQLRLEEEWPPPRAALHVRFSKPRHYNDRGSVTKARRGGFLSDRFFALFYSRSAS